MLPAFPWTRVAGMGLYVAIVLFVMLPLSWALFGSFKPQPELFNFPPTILPQTFSLSAYREVLERTPMATYLFNSLVVTGGATLVVLVFATTAAYGFSRWDFRGKDVVMVSLLVCQLIPSAVTIIPYYVMMNTLDLLNTRTALVMIFSATHIPFAIWILKSHFDSISQSLDEAAIIDGCSRLRVIWNIILPVSLPAIGAAACLTFITVWAEFLVPMVIANSPETMVVSVGIYNLFGRDSTTLYNLLFAAAVMATAPVVIAYLIAQEQFISGLTGGAEK